MKKDYSCRTMLLLQVTLYSRCRRQTLGKTDDLFLQQSPIYLPPLLWSVNTCDTFSWKRKSIRVSKSQEEGERIPIIIN